jgi:hypothetical protein
VADEAGPQEFTKKELRLVAAACESFPLTSRFLRHLRRWLVQLFQGGVPGLAGKLSSLSDSEFERLYEHIKDRKKGSR